MLFLYVARPRPLDLTVAIGRDLEVHADYAQFGETKLKENGSDRG